MLRRIRAVVITGLLWGLVWLPVGAAVGFVQYQRGGLIDVLSPPPGIMLRVIAQFTLQWGFLGFINGALFAVLLAIAERGRTLATLSVRRVAFWGALGTLVLPAVVLLIALVLFGPSGLFVKLVPMVSVLALGAASGTAMFLVARRAPASADRQVSAA